MQQLIFDLIIRYMFQIFTQNHRRHYGRVVKACGALLACVYPRKFISNIFQTRTSPRKKMLSHGFARTGSSPVGVDFFLFLIESRRYSMFLCGEENGERGGEEEGEFCRSKPRKCPKIGESY